MEKEIKSNSFKVSLFITIITLALVLIAGCGTNNADNTKPQETKAADTAADGQKDLSGSIEIGVLPAEGTSGYKFLTNIGDQIKADHPNTDFKYVFANTKARPFMEQRWRSNNPPDIDYFVFNGQVPKTYEFIDKLLDLTPYLNEKLPGQETKWIDTFLPMALPIMGHEGKYYGVMTDTHVLGLYYNKKMFDELNLTPPKTWEEFMAVGQKLKENKIDPVAVTGQYNPYMEMWIDYLFQREVGYAESVEAIRGKGFKDNPGFLNAAKKIQDMRDQGFLMKGFEGTDFTAAQIQFFQGKAGMLLMGSWLTSEMKDSIPPDFQVGFTAFPTVKDGKGQQNGLIAHANIMSVNKSSKNLDLVLEYLRRLTSQEVQTKRAEEQSLVSPIQGAPVPKGINGLKEAIDNGGDLNVRYLGLEFEPDIFNAYSLEASKLFFGEYSAEQYIDAIDALAKKFKK